MANRALNLFPKKKESSRDLVGFDLNEFYLKIVHVKVSQLKREVIHLASFDVQEMADEAVSALVEKTLNELKLKSPRAFLSAPLYPMITRSIEIPSGDPGEIREIVNLQASRHTPYSRSEIIVETLNLGLVRENYTKVLIVILPRDVVMRQTRILEKAGLKLEKVLFPPEGMCQAYSKILGGDLSGSTVAVVHMDAWFTSFLVIQKNKILFLRGITTGANQLLDEKETYRERFVEELRRSLESYTQDEAGPQPSLLLLTGVAAETSDLDDLFEGPLPIPIKHQTYFNYFAISKEAREVALTSKRVSFFNVIAPLLLFDKVKVDLVSEETRLNRQLEQRGSEAIRAGILVMVFLGLSVVLFTFKVFFKSVYSHHLAVRYKPVIEEARSLEIAYEKMRVIKSHLGDRGTSLEVLSELYDILPIEIRITDIRYEEGIKLNVKGTSRAMAPIFSFVTNLEKSKMFKSVKTKYVTTRNEGEEDWADFEIDAVIEKEKASAS